MYRVAEEVLGYDLKKVQPSPPPRLFSLTCSGMVQICGADVSPTCFPVHIPPARATPPLSPSPPARATPSCVHPAPSLFFILYSSFFILYSLRSTLFRQIVLEGPEEMLTQTEHAQPALLIAGLAAHEKLKRDSPEVVARCR